jgi:hypothetical protein
MQQEGGVSYLDPLEQVSRATLTVNGVREPHARLAVITRASGVIVIG